MKYIITEEQKRQLSEMIKLDIKVGDTLLGGKFKNKKVVVKTIGKNEKGDITINGKPLLRFRILKEGLTNEFNVSSWLKRRISKQKMDAYIANNIDEYNNICDDFDNENEFSNQVIDTSAMDYSYEIGDTWDTWENDDKIVYLLTKYFHQYYFDKLCNVFKESCEDQDDDDDDEEN